MTKPAAVIFDLDGTLANIEHRLHFITDGNDDWDGFFEACSEDAPKLDIIELAQIYHEADYAIVIMSGRSEAVHDKTMYWLDYYDVPVDMLWMRSEDDFRPDQIVKKEFLTTVEEIYSIKLCVDDRSKVVKMWRDEGYTCLQVADGDF